jgi:hypothetical protein
MATATANPNKNMKQLQYVTLGTLLKAEYTTDTQALLNRASDLSLSDLSDVIPGEILESNAASNYMLNGKLDIIKRQVAATIEHRKGL